MKLRDSYRKMCTANKGGWPTMSAALGMSRDSLENRVYERKNQSVSVHDSLQMQKISETTFFADAIAAESGGVFIQLPESEICDREELLSKFNDLHAEIGMLSAKFKVHTKDGHVTKKERADLNETGQLIHRHVQELLALTFTVYCQSEKDSDD